jgi:hypothetical protein
MALPQPPVECLPIWVPVGPTVYILRGVSGSGKSSMTKAILKSMESIAQTSRPEDFVVVASADDYFLQNAERKYKFDASRLKDAHADCALKFRKALVDGVPIIIVDNTNTQVWQYREYEGSVAACNAAVMAGRLAGPTWPPAAAAAAAGGPASLSLPYEIRIVELFCPDAATLYVFNSRQTHGVTWEGSARQWVQWEDDMRGVKMQAFIDKTREQPIYEYAKEMQAVKLVQAQRDAIVAQQSGRGGAGTALASAAAATAAAAASASAKPKVQAQQPWQQEQQQQQMQMQTQQKQQQARQSQQSVRPAASAVSSSYNSSSSSSSSVAWAGSSSRPGAGAGAGAGGGADAWGGAWGDAWKGAGGGGGGGGGRELSPSKPPKYPGGAGYSSPSFSGGDAGGRARSSSKASDTSSMTEESFPSRVLTRIHYVGIFLTKGARRELLRALPAARGLPVRIADHLTIAHAPSSSEFTPTVAQCIGMTVQIQVLGWARDREVMAAIVRWPGADLNPEENSLSPSSGGGGGAGVGASASARYAAAASSYAFGGAMDYDAEYDLSDFGGGNGGGGGGAGGYEGGDAAGDDGAAAAAAGGDADAVDEGDDDGYFTDYVRTCLSHVSTNGLSRNDVPHITVATATNVSPSRSNEMLMLTRRHMALEHPILLTGRVGVTVFATGGTKLPLTRQDKFQDWLQRKLQGGKGQ